MGAQTPFVQKRWFIVPVWHLPTLDSYHGLALSFKFDKESRLSSTQHCRSSARACP